MARWASDGGPRSTPCRWASSRRQGPRRRELLTWAAVNSNNWTRCRQRLCCSRLPNFAVWPAIGNSGTHARTRTQWTHETKWRRPTLWLFLVILLLLLFGVYALHNPRSYMPSFLLMLCCAHLAWDAWRGWPRTCLRCKGSTTQADHPYTHHEARTN